MRIRTVKPDLFRHEKLSDLENANPNAHVILTYAGLFGLCAKNGTFEWKPRHIKLDVLPFIDYDQLATLNLLVENGFISRFNHDGSEYGCITTLPLHQRFTGREKENAPILPDPPKAAQKTVPLIRPLFAAPSLAEVTAHFLQLIQKDAKRATAQMKKQADIEATLFLNYYTARKWHTKGGDQITNWQSQAETWFKRSEKNAPKNRQINTDDNNDIPTRSWSNQ